jgi:CRP-like cAMP-binding protein
VPQVHTSLKTGLQGAPRQDWIPTATVKSPLSPELTGATMSFGRNAEIYGEGETAEFVYQVVSGAVRTYKVLADGRRQIASFYLPGDMFGLEIGDTHAFSAEAISSSKIALIKRNRIADLAARDNEVSHQLFNAVGGELRRVQDHILLLIKTAQERVAGFLLEMAKRSAGQNEIDLPMSRQDIADYLGLTIETVSRTITSLEHAEFIALPSARTILVRNLPGLKRIAA